MKNKIFLSRAIATLIAILSIFAFSTVTFAVADYEIDNNMTVTVETMDSAEDTYSIENMKKSRSSDDSNMGTVIVVSVAISVLITGVTVFLIYRSYKTNGMTEPYPYNDKAPLQLTEADDHLVDVKVTKVKIKRD